MLRGEEAWAAARFRESRWNQENPECLACGGKISDDGQFCLSCGTEYETDEQKRRRNSEEKADYIMDDRADE